MPSLPNTILRRERLDLNLPWTPITIHAPTVVKTRWHLDHKTQSLLQKWRLRRLKVSIPHGYYFSLSRNKYLLLDFFLKIISKRRASKHKIFANACWNKSQSFKQLKIQSILWADVALVEKLCSGGCGHCSSYGQIYFCYYFFWPRST